MPTPDPPIHCEHCGKITTNHSNFCDWNCNIANAKAHGGKIHTPNGLPIKCIEADHTMLEIGHGNHIDYKFPVECEFIGEIPKDLPEWDYSYVNQVHAVIYTDGNIAITIYECCYAMWYVKDGKIGGGSSWEKNEWKLTDESILKIYKCAG